MQLFILLPNQVSKLSSDIIIKYLKAQFNLLEIIAKFGATKKFVYGSSHLFMEKIKQK